MLHLGLTLEEFAKFTDLSSIIEVSDNLFCILDLESQKVYTNSQWSKFFGHNYSGNTIVNLYELMDSNQIKEIENLLEYEILNNKLILSKKLICLDENKNKFLTNWNLKYLADKKYFLCAVSVDIQSKNFHLSVNEMKTESLPPGDADERFRAIVDHIPVMISLFDKNGNFEWVNKVWRDELGWSIESMSGRDMLSEFFPDTELRNDVLAFMLSKQTGWKDFYLRKKDGSNIYTSWANIHLENGKAIGIGKNINDRHSLQAQLIQTSKKVSLGELASGVAHEINNPLTVIYGKANYLINQIKKQKINYEQLIGDLEKISLNSERIATIVKSLRSFSIDSESTPFSQVQIKSAFEDALNICRQLFKNKKIELEIHLNSDFIVFGRSSDLSQAFLNLITNSYEAVLNVENKWIRVESEINQDFYLIRITDSGPGISKKNVDKIMYPFFTTKPIGQGVGLGLSLAASIFEKHGGKIEYDNNSKNTSFIIRLPRGS